MEHKSLGEGSIVMNEAGRMFMKMNGGTWWRMQIVSGSAPVNIDNLGKLTLLHKAEHNPLEGLKKGSIITFGDGEVAVKRRVDFWKIPGSVYEFTDEELLSSVISDPTSVEVLR